MPAAFTAQSQGGLLSALVVTACAAQNYSTGPAKALTQDKTGDLCTNGTGGGGGGAVTIASGGVASGAFASGSISSGAVSSGAVASGAFASGSIGSGAIASGAVSAGAIASGAAVAGSFVDGAIATLGTEADTAYVGTGNSTVNAGIRGIYAAAISAPNLNITGPAVAAWTGMTPGGTAASTQYAGDVNVAGIKGIVPLMGSGATGTGSQRTTVAQDATTTAGANPGRTYNTIAAGQTSQKMSSTQAGGTGATGDYLAFCVIVPGTVNPGAVTIADGTTAVYSFAGGTASVTTLISWSVPIGAVSTTGAWEITTGTNVTVNCTGKFT